MNDLIPISDEQAKAIQEAAKFGGISVEAISELCRWGGKVLGTIPQDFLAFVMGDRLRFRRIKNLIGYRDEIEKLLIERAVNVPKEISPSLAEPLLEAAADETDETLRGLWARLIANAMDPKKSGLVRLSLVELLKQFDPVDAVVLQHFTRHSFDIADDAARGTPSVMAISDVASMLKSNSTEVEVSLLRLVKLQCVDQRLISDRHGMRHWAIAPAGRLLLAAVS